MHITLGFDDDIARLTLARPAAANALSGDMLREITDALAAVREQAPRALVLAGEGKHFCAGADVEWMRQSTANSDEENRREAKVLADLLHALHTLPLPVVAVAHGACYGGGAGLLAAADICIAADSARFCFSEVRLGLIPATISPYVVAAVGERMARRYFLDGTPFSAATAQRIGLVHEVAAAEALDDALQTQLAALRAGGTDAQQRIKELLQRLRPLRSFKMLVSAEEMAEYTANALAECRAGDEAKEGVAAFLEKRDPSWRSEQGSEEQ